MRDIFMKGVIFLVTITMRDKSLSLKSDVPIYQYENNADIIKCLIPTIYNGKDLKDATIVLWHKNENGYGDRQEIKFTGEKYRDDYYIFNGVIDRSFTQYAGTLTIWLKIYIIDVDTEFETNTATLSILPSKSIPTNIEDVEKPFFDTWLIQMNQVLNKCITIQRECIEMNNETRRMIENIKQ